MAEPRPPDPALLIVAVLTRHEELFSFARERLEQEYGPIEMIGERFPFHQTTYYNASMGEDLHKELLVFREPILPDRLAKIKHHTNALEKEARESGGHPEARPLNLDPGLLTLAKLILASMKDHSHRIYIGEQVYAEVTLYFREGEYRAWPWSYADYQQESVKRFLSEARGLLRR